MLKYELYMKLKLVLLGAGNFSKYYGGLKLFLLDIHVKIKLDLFLV